MKQIEVYLFRKFLHIVFPNSTKNVRHFLLIVLLYICLYICINLIRLLLLEVGKQKQEWVIGTTKVYYYLRHTTKCSALCYWSSPPKTSFHSTIKPKLHYYATGCNNKGSHYFSFLSGYLLLIQSAPGILAFLLSIRNRMLDST